MARNELIAFLKANGVSAAFHYTPLHSSEFGKNHGAFVGEDIYTTQLSSRLLRLPLYYGLKHEEIEYVASKIYNFYGVDFKN